MKWRSLEESASQEITRSLQDIYAERKALIAKYVPAEIQAVHTRVVDDLRQSGIVNRALQVGSKAPEFELPDQNGKIVHSSELLASDRLVICFIRGRWCPFCVGQVQAMNAVVEQLKELNGLLVAISPQTVHQSYLMADQHRLHFPLLSDTRNKVARQFGVVYQVPEYQREIYQRVFTNLPFLNGDDSWELPIPAVYVLGVQHSPGEIAHADPHYSVLYAHVNPEYTERPEPDEIVGFLSRISH
jgi:peroxiredoxin